MHCQFGHFSQLYERKQSLESDCGTQYQSIFLGHVKEELIFRFSPHCALLCVVIPARRTHGKISCVKDQSSLSGTIFSKQNPYLTLLTGILTKFGPNMAKSLMHWLKSDVKLVKITEVDDIYRHNPFILTGYREKTSFLGCLKSLLVLHNETINIWSHLIGFIFFVAIFWRDILFIIPAKESGVEVAYSDFFVICSLIICYQVRNIFKNVF